MTSKEALREKILDISNSEFPLILFFNDIEQNEGKNFNKEQAYEDIEKIYNVFEYYRSKNKKLEKALDILKEKLEIELHKDDLYFLIPMISGSEIYQNLTQEEYKLLKEVIDGDNNV